MKNTEFHFREMKFCFLIRARLTPEFHSELASLTLAEFHSCSSCLSSYSSKADWLCTISSTKTSSTMQVIALTFPQKRCLIEKTTCPLSGMFTSSFCRRMGCFFFFLQLAAFSPEDSQSSQNLQEKSVVGILEG